jgi:hypothetical protein
VWDQFKGMDLPNYLSGQRPATLADVFKAFGRPLPAGVM